MLVNCVHIVCSRIRFVGLDICFNAPRHRSSVLILLQGSCGMLRSCRSGTSLFVGAYVFPNTSSAHPTFSFFSSLFTATKNFPNIIGTASAASTVMYGLSPLFLCSFATNAFTDPRSGLDLTNYLVFLAILGGTVNLFGACVLTVPNGHAAPEAVDEEPEVSADETTRLLPGPRKCDEEVDMIAVREPDELSLANLLKDPYFWIFFVFMSLTIGCVSVPVSPRNRG